MPVALEIRDLVKGFGGVPVLKAVSFSVRAGEVTVLAGENGAGKSTLINIVTGQLRQDAGQVLIYGEELPHPDPSAARALGVGIIPQELSPYPDLTVYENLFVGRELRTSLGLLDRRKMIAEAKEMLEAFGADIDPRRVMGSLSVALTQVVEIVKSTTWGVKVLLLDEPTSAITGQEVERLYRVVRRLKEQGVAMVYVTHRMAEIEELADDVVVLRDGILVLDEPSSNVDERAIVHAMIGRELAEMFPDVHPSSADVALEVEGLQLHRGGPRIDLSVRRGEILGLGGLVGAGRTEILEALFGIRPSVHGSVRIAGKDVRRNDPAGSIAAGVAFVPEDRKGAGLVLSMSVLDNGSLPHLEMFSVAGWMRRSRRAAVSAATDSVQLQARSIDQMAGTLSGGNQQKVVLARWLTQHASVLLLDEPTRGVDVGARGEIYNIVRDLAQEGLAVILASSDMPELMGLSHRVLVIRDGKASGEMSREELDQDDAQERVFRLASGQVTEASATASTDHAPTNGSHGAVMRPGASGEGL